MQGIGKYISSYLKRGDIVRLLTENEDDESVSLFYLESIGLALRGIDNSWNDSDPIVYSLKKWFLNKKVEKILKLNN